MTATTVTFPSRSAALRALLALLLLALALGGLALGLAESLDGIDVAPLFGLAGTGVLIGWILGSLGLPGWTVGLLGAALGAEAVVLLGGSLPGWMDIPSDLSDLSRQASMLTTVFREWAAAFVVGESALDPGEVALVWHLAVWAVSVWAGWAVRRRNRPLLALAPAGLLLTVTLARADDPEAGARFLFPLLSAALMLSSLSWLNTREASWRDDEIEPSRDIQTNLMRWIVPLSLALTMLATFVPQVTWDDISDLIWKRSVVVVVAPPAGWDRGRDPWLDQGIVAFEDVRDIGLPRSHLVGARERDLSRQVVMEIQTDELRPGLQTPPRNYYWRSLVYDQYDGQGWSAGDTQILQYEPREEIIGAFPPYHEMIRQDVEVMTGTVGLVHSAGHLVSVDRAANVALRLPRPPEDALGAFIESSSYGAVSMVPLAGERELRAAGDDYPEWIRERYTALPYTVPDRVLELARDLTASGATPYDRALILESFLRTYTYVLDVPLPPPDQDVADYFLFELQQGYCDYYATAMVVLARAVDLPARLVIGYAAGAYDPDNGKFIVTEADAHAWVEVYFPNFGWIEFEPTGGRPEIDRSAEVGSVESDDQQNDLDLVDQLTPALPSFNLTQRSKWGWWLGLAGGLVAVGFAGATWWGAEKRRLGRLPPSAAIAGAYCHLRGQGRMIEMPMWEGDTPYEFAGRLRGHVAEVSQGRRWEALVVPAIQEAQELIELYVRSCYTPHVPGIAEKWRALRLWAQLRRRLWAVRLIPTRSSRKADLSQ